MTAADEYVAVTADEAEALTRMRDGTDLIVHTPGGVFVRVPGGLRNGDAGWALDALAEMRRPVPPPPPTAAERADEVVAEAEAEVAETVRRGLVVGRVYDVTMADCCVDGRLRVGAYLGPDMQPDPPGVDYHGGWRFEAGVIGPAWGHFEFIDVTPP